MPYKDPEKKRQYQKEWKKRNPQDQKPGKDSRRDLVNKLKDKPCLHCGVKYPPCVIDLHHVDPSQKSFEVVPNGRGKDALIEEAKKCVCLCSNCHRLFHGGHIELNLESWQSG